MGCCVSRVKDNKNKSFEEEESSENPLNVLKKKIFKGQIAEKIEEISKKNKNFEKQQDTEDTNLNNEEANFNPSSCDWNTILDDNDSLKGDRDKKIK
jgi:hypothetical protein